MHVETSITIARPIEDVFEFATAWDNYAKWQEGVEESVQTSPGPIQIGTTSRHRSRFMGRPVVVEGVVTEYDPPHLLAYRVSGSFSYVGRQVFRTIGSATEATYAFDAKLPLAMRLIGPLTAAIARRRIRRDYQRLKVLLESSPVPE